MVFDALSVQPDLSAEDAAAERQINRRARMGCDAETIELIEGGDTLNRRKCPDIILKLQIAYVQRHIHTNPSHIEKMQHFAHPAAQPAGCWLFDAEGCVDKIKTTIKTQGLAGADTSQPQQRSKAQALARGTSSRANGYDLKCPKTTLQRIQSAHERAPKVRQRAQASLSTRFKPRCNQLMNFAKAKRRVFFKTCIPKDTGSQYKGMNHG